MDDPKDPRKAEPIARSWSRFQTHVLPAVLAEPTPEAVELANLSFYFGAIALLAILGAAIDGAENEEAVAFMRETLDAELTAFVKSREADLH